MRMTREELIIQYPSWNEAKHDIVAALYGDIPSRTWDLKEYEYFCTLTGTMSNILSVDAYIFTQYGEYNIYNTLNGRVYIRRNGDVLAGDFNVHYDGQTYSCYLNMMYGWKALDILRIGVGNIVGFSNKDGNGSPSIYTKEMDKDLIDKILYVNELNDFGIGVQKFMEKVREIYYSDTENYIMNKGLMKR